MWAHEHMERERNKERKGEREGREGYIFNICSLKLFYEAVI